MIYARNKKFVCFFACFGGAFLHRPVLLAIVFESFHYLRARCSLEWNVVLAHDPIRMSKNNILDDIIVSSESRGAAFVGVCFL